MDTRIWRMGIGGGALLVLCGQSSPAQSARASVVRGVVTEGTTHAPLAGTVVMFLDASGATTVRTVSDAAGRYRLSSTGIAKTVRAIRIGYTPATLPLAANSDSVVVDLQLDRLPPVLTAVHVIDQPECPADAHGGEAFALWEQTRAALLATVVAQDANPATITMITYGRTLTPDGAQVRSQTMRDSTFLSTHGVVSRRGATEYATLGYREVDREHDVEHYYAPDAEVLLDSAFARSHCISFRGESAANPGDVGLAFTPLPHPKTQGDSLIDVSGTIWIRQQSPVLHSIDFQFTNTSAVRSSSDTLAGGSMIYREMPNGTAFVTRWTIANGAGSIASATLSLLASSDAALPAYRRRSIQIEDSTSSTPLAGVEVIDVSAQRTLGSTGESGRVGLASLPEGTTLLRVRKPGFAQRVIVFDISPRDTTPLVVRLQHVEQLATVTVTASMLSRTATASGFDSRLAARQGHFLTGAELQRRDGEPLSSALANLGMREQSRGSAIILLGGRTNRPCPVTIFVDGFLLYSSIPAGMAPVDARSLNAGDYGAAEYYADTDTAPAQFKMTGAMCGTLLLWTRN